VYVSKMWSLGTCETWATTKGTGTVSTNLQQEGILWNLQFGECDIVTGPQNCNLENVT
jgi:hypothetical protein